MEKHLLEDTPYNDLVQYTIFCSVNKEAENGAELLVGALRSRKSISGPELAK